MAQSDLDFLNATLSASASSRPSQARTDESEPKEDESTLTTNLCSIRQSLEAIQSSSQGYLNVNSSLPDMSTLDEAELTALLAELDNVEDAADGLEARLDGLLGTLDGMLNALEGVPAQSQASVRVTVAGQDQAPNEQPSRGGRIEEQARDAEQTESTE